MNPPPTVLLIRGENPKIVVYSSSPSRFLATKGKKKVLFFNHTSHVCLDWSFHGRFSKLKTTSSACACLSETCMSIRLGEYCNFALGIEANFPCGWFFVFFFVFFFVLFFLNSACGKIVKAILYLKILKSGPKSVWKLHHFHKNDKKKKKKKKKIVLLSLGRMNAAVCFSHLLFFYY
ncbi:hypothetical protein AOLI_G00068980 [Acnodon oligacanthus]